MEEVEETIRTLEQLGLTEYEARCFVALTRIPHGTAREVGQVADIPRSRVYETMERLDRKGLIEIQEGEPRQFQSVSPDAAIRILRKQYESYFSTIEERLHELEPVYKEAKQAVWAITNHEQVTERMIDIVADADDEILLIVVEDGLLDEEVLTSLSEAGERGVDIAVGTPLEAVRDAVSGADFDASVFSTDLIEWFAEMSGPSRTGQILMADRGPILVSAVHGEQLPGVPNETAAWSDGADHGFATFAHRVLTYELKENAPDVYDAQ